MREDRHAELGRPQSPHGIQALREGIHHHCTRAELDGARSAADQRVRGAGDVRRVTNMRRNRLGNRPHALLERARTNVPEQLVVFDQISPAGGEGRRCRCDLSGRQAERRLDDRTDEHFVRRSEGRAR